MRAFELRKQIAQKKGQAKALVDGAESENRDMSADERTQFDGLLSEVESLKSRVAALEAVEATEDQVSDEPPARKSTPMDLETRGAKAPVHSDLHRYSLLRAIGRQLSGAPLDGVEKEVSEEIAKRSGKSPQGFYMPSALNIRALTTTTGAGGVVTEYSGTVIDLLRNQTVVIQAGATLLTGMQGTFAIPRQTGAATAYWVLEGQCPTASNATLDQVVFAPRTVGAYTDVTRKFIHQTSLDAEAFVRADLARVIAIALDQAALSGSGGADPLGLFNDPAVPTVASGGADGGAASWATIVGLETQVAAANGLFGELAYVSNARVNAYLKTTPKVGTTYPVFIMDADGTVNGYDFLVTNNVAANFTKGGGTGLSGIVFGNWNDYVIASWGDGYDILVDPYTGSCSGTVRIVALQDVDMHPRHPLSFAKSTDMATG